MRKKKRKNTYFLELKDFRKLVWFLRKKESEEEYSDRAEAVLNKLLIGSRVHDWSVVSMHLGTKNMSELISLLLESTAE